MDNMKQIRHKLKETVTCHNVAQLQMDVVALKGCTVNLMIYNGRTSDFPDDVGVRAIIELNYQ